MISKIIHYCWFGHNSKPALAKKCIKSWEKYCPDYQIVEWNEDNFDIASCPLYVRQAYEAKKWAFVTDYVRLKVVYDYGGIYMDTDVELLKNLDFLLEHHAYFGFEDGKYVNTGLGFGAKKGSPILLKMMEDYWDIPFVLEDGTFDVTACPGRNTKVLLRYGLRQDNSQQMIDDCLILPSDYLCPVNYQTGKFQRTERTVSAHWFSASWQTQEEKCEHKKKKHALERVDRIHNLKHIPHRVMRMLLGDVFYERIKRTLKRE